MPVDDTAAAAAVAAAAARDAVRSANLASRISFFSFQKSAQMPPSEAPPSTHFRQSSFKKKIFWHV